MVPVRLDDPADHHPGDVPLLLPVRRSPLHGQAETVQAGGRADRVQRHPGGAQYLASV